MCLTLCHYPSSLSPLSMSLPLPVVNVPTMPDDASADPIDSATSFKIGDIMYDWEKDGYKLEWEIRADFKRWLTHKQQAVGIDIQRSKTCLSNVQQIYVTCETFCCAHNRLKEAKSYKKKMAGKRKIGSKQIKGGCPYYVQIKTYLHTDTILDKYKFNHSHETGKNNLKYIQIHVFM